MKKPQDSLAEALGLTFLLLCLIISSCAPLPATGTAPAPTISATVGTVPAPTLDGPIDASPTPSHTPVPATATSQPATATVTSQPATQTSQPLPQVPNFEHIILIVLENRDYREALDGQSMPYLKALADKNVLLSNYFAVRHPSLPNYIALVSGSTQGISKDCTDCFVDQPNLADLIEVSGRTWKTYQQDMPSPCFVGNAKPYVQKHDPFIYFNSIRLNAERCQRSIQPLSSLETDLAANQLPNFAFIMPNMCNSGHDCPAATADNWLKDMLTRLQSAPAVGKNSLIIVTFDEGGEKSTGSCCGMGSKAGGQVATVLVSPLAKAAYQDGTAYSHYSLLKTILTAWHLPDLENTQLPETQPISSPWGEQPAPSPSETSTPPSATASATAIPGMSSELAFPIRAAFYYPWFPQAWKQGGLNPFSQYQPSLGFYDQDQAAVIQTQIAAMQYGHIQLGIASWWGQGHHTDKRIPALIKEAEQTGFHWSLYVESEGSGNPTVEAIRSDLEYIRDHYASSPAYLNLNGRFVVFVYADARDGCEMSQRWKDANTVGAALVLKVFPGYQSCPSQPESWHQYAPAVSQKGVGTASFSISPGFWKAGETNPRLARDPQRWNADIKAMIASKANFQLVTTFNEWGEGTAVESAQSWESASGYGTYLDALHFDGSQ